MSGTEAKTVFATDIKQYERDIAKLQKDNAKLTESLRKVKTEAGSMGDAWSAALKKTAAANDSWAAGLKQVDTAETRRLRSNQLFNVVLAQGRSSTLGMTSATAAYIPQLAAVAAGLGAAGVAVGYLRSEYSAFRTELEASTQAHREFQQRLVKDIAVSRDALQGAEIERFVSSVPGVKQEDVRASLAGVTRETPTAGLKRREQIAGEISRLAPTGQDLGELGGIAGQIADIMPGVSGRGAAQRAALMVREAGGDIGKLQKDKMQRSMQQLMAKGMSADDALAMGIAAAQGQISPETLTAIATGGKLSKASQLEKSRLTPENLERNKRMIQGIDTGEDIIGGVGKGMLQTEAGRGARTRYATGQTKETRAALETRREELFQQYDEMVRASQAGHGFVGRTVGEASIQGAKLGRDLFMPEANEDQVKGLEIIIGQLRASMERNSAAVENANRQRGAVNVDKNVD